MLPSQEENKRPPLDRDPVPPSWGLPDRAGQGAGPGNGTLRERRRAAPHGVRRSPADGLQPGFAGGDAQPAPAGRAWPRLAGRRGGGRPQARQAPVRRTDPCLCRSRQAMRPWLRMPGRCSSRLARKTLASCKASAWTTWCWVVAWVPTRLRRRTRSRLRTRRAPRRRAPMESRVGAAGSPSPTSDPSRFDGTRRSCPAGVPSWPSWTRVVTHTNGSRMQSTSPSLWTGCPSATTTRQPIPSCTATSTGSSTACSTRMPATARSSQGWCTRPALTRTSLSGGSCPRTGPLVEKDWIIALAQILELVRRHAKKLDGGTCHRHPQPVDGVLPRDPAGRDFDPVLRDIMVEFGRLGTIVVCSAGNDATARPSYPAAFAPWSDGNGPVPVDKDVVPLVSVGARNPNDKSDALFSNAGPWVRQVRARCCGDEHHPAVRRRPAADGGDEGLTAGSGAVSIPTTSAVDSRSGAERRFAAPLFAGRLAAEILPHLPKGTSPDTGAAVERGWNAVEASDRHHAMMSGWIGPENLHHRGVSRTTRAPVRHGGRLLDVPGPARPPMLPM